MIKTFIKNIFFVLLLAIFIVSCQKTEYSFGDLVSPADLQLTAQVDGVDGDHPDGDGSGSVTINIKAQHVLNYKFDFGDGNIQMLPSGSINYKYSKPGTNEYTITVNAIGTGGIISTVSQKVKVFVAFEIPAEILQNLTGGSSKVWMCDKDADGHFGVGPADLFYPMWYAAAANSRAADGFYDDEITFAKTASNQVTLNLDNKGSTFILGGAVSYYGQSGGEGQYPLSTLGVKELSFMNATSASTPDNSTRIQFSVPGNGLVCVGLGTNMYEILSLTSTTMELRVISSDTNAWYQKFKVKP